MKREDSFHDFRTVFAVLKKFLPKFSWRKSFTPMIRFYHDECIAALDDTGAPKDEQSARLEKCIAGLGKFGEPPPALEEALLKRLNELGGSGALAGNEPSAENHGERSSGSPPEDDAGDSQANAAAYNGPEKSRRVVKYSDLVSGKVAIPLLGHLIASRNKPVKKGAMQKWVDLSTAKDTSLELDGRKIEALSESKAMEGVFWLGGVTGGVGAQPDGRVRCRPGRRGLGFGALHTRCGGADEWIAVHGAPNALGDRTQPAWGSAFFAFRENGYDLEITGELLSWLKKAEMPEKPMFYLKDADGKKRKLDFQFTGENSGSPRLAWKDFFPRKEMNVKLAGDTDPVEFGRILNEAMNDLDAANNTVFHARIGQKPYYRQILAKGVATMYQYVEARLANKNELLEAFHLAHRTKSNRKQFATIKQFSDFQDSANYPAFKEFAHWLLKLIQADPEQQHQRKREKTLDSVRKVREIEVWSGESDKGGAFLVRGTPTDVETDPENE